MVRLVYLASAGCLPIALLIALVAASWDSLPWQWNAWPQPVAFPLPYSLLWLLLPGIHYPGNGMPGLRHWRHLTPSGPGAPEVPDASEPPSPDQQPLLMPLSNLPAPIATGLKRYPVTCWRSSDKNALMALLFLLRTKKGWHCKSGDPKDYCRRMADMQMLFLFCWDRGNPGQV